jgi:hypothetical protein
MRLPRVLPLTASIILVGGACHKPPPPPEDFADNASQAVTGAAAGGDSMRVDVYVDGTVSMSGFLNAGSSQYVEFLDDLESSVQNSVRRPQIRYFKFGRAVRELDRDGFRAARTPAFYAERGISDVTQIDSVIQCPAGAHVTVAVTDLFQDEGDVQAVVARIKERCFARGAAVGVLAVPSQFNGMVYDARVPAYRYASTAERASYRPFYALLFGAPEHVERLHAALQAQPYVKAGHFTLIAPYVVRDFQVALAKSPDSRHLNRRSEERPGHFRFDVRKGGDGGTLTADVTVRLKPSAPDYRSERVELVAFRRAGADSVRTEDIALDSVRRRGDVLNATLRLRAPAEPGTYAYRLSLVTGALDGFVPPAWVRTLSSPNPTAADGPNRTLNLERFVTDLRRAASSVHAPELARWYVDVRRL